MTKSELIERLCAEQTHLSAKEIEDAVKDILGTHGFDTRNWR